MPKRRGDLSYFRVFEGEASFQEISLLEALREYGVGIIRTQEDEVREDLLAYALAKLDEPLNKWKKITPEGPGRCAECPYIRILRVKEIVMLTHEDRGVLTELTARIRERFPGARVWAYGSRVRGTAAWDSDFDVCIVLQQVDREIDRWIRDMAWEVGFENDRVITTVVMDNEEFEHGPMSESTLVGNILQEGVAA